MTINQFDNIAFLDFGATATSGTLSVIANDGGLDSDPLTMNIAVGSGTIQDPAFFVESTDNVNQGDAGVVYTILDMDPSYTYTWSYTGAGTTINNNGTNSVSVDYSTTATSGDMSVKASNGCAVSNPLVLPVTVNTTTGTEDYTSSFTMNVYPNPSASDATLEIYSAQSGDIKVEIYSADGKYSTVLYEGVDFNGAQTLELNELPAGMYIIQMTMGDKILTERFVKLK